MAIKNGLLGQDPPPYELVQRPGSLLFRRRRRVLGTLLLIAILVVLVQLESITITPTSVPQTQSFAEGLIKCYQGKYRGQQDTQASNHRSNPRWNPITGQQIPIVIKGASLFDGDSTQNGTFDIIFDSGVIRSVFPASTQNPIPEGARVIDGGFVTPGLVDMHSHHLLLPFPHLPSTSDVNERPLLGPITPFVRSLDGFKPYDPAIKIIASGGVTSSLVLPGSANIVGGEVYMVKNLQLPGPAGEPVIDELLLEHGLPENSRQRYLKMACGENPKGIYGNTRLGLTWLLREQLGKARELLERQTTWCEAAFEIEASTFAKTRRISSFLNTEGKRPDSFEFETLLALLKGDLNVNVHCYEPEDFERMLSVLHEFDVHPRAFHHALEAWQVPELLKHLEENITIATFAENSLFKAEAYGANLRGPKILDDHGVQVALKSDHTGEEDFAKYLVYQAAIAHSFGLPEDKALQSVTSIPARSVQQNHRIGYVRPGFDADLVIWDDHPLQVGATPSEVFIDGRSALHESKSSDELTYEAIRSSELHETPVMRASITPDQKEDICGRVQGPHSKVLFTGIQEVLIDTPTQLAQDTENLTLLVEDGQITCLDEISVCVSSSGSGDGLTQIELSNGCITPGLVAFGNNIGIQSIPSESSTGDGSAAKSGDALNEHKAVHFAKYGVHFLGKAFTRARIGGVTKAITAPHSGGGIIQGVSVGLRTSVNATILNGGIWKDDVALHLTMGQTAKGDDTPTVSSGIERLRQVLDEGKGAESGIYRQAARGSLTVVIRAFNEDDISQLILVKRDFPSVRLVLYGGHAAPLVANSLAEADIPVILTGNCGAPDSWEKQNVLTGPPLTESPAKILTNAGVLLGLAVKSDSKIHGLAQEARWAGKYAGLTDKEAIALVSTNLEDILGIRSNGKGHYEPLAQPYTGDFVVWEGSPLRGEGSVVVAIQEGGNISDCWPDTTNAVL